MHVVITLRHLFLYYIFKANLLKERDQCVNVFVIVSKPSCPVFTFVVIEIHSFNVILFFDTNVLNQGASLETFRVQ